MIYTTRPVFFFFKPKGADRKLKTDREKIDKKTPQDREKYQPSHDTTLLKEVRPERTLCLPSALTLLNLAVNSWVTWMFLEFDQIWIFPPSFCFASLLTKPCKPLLRYSLLICHFACCIVCFKSFLSLLLSVTEALSVLVCYSPGGKENLRNHCTGHVHYKNHTWHCSNTYHYKPFIAQEVFIGRKWKVFAKCDIDTC